MNTHRYPGQIAWQGFLVVLLATLAFQSLGMNSLAAPASTSNYFQAGGNPQPLACSPAPTPTACDIQIVLLIDDSGSMRTNDPSSLRNAGAKNVVDILDRQYYAPASLLHEENPDFRLPDVQVAVVHFSKGVLRSPELSDWIKFGSTDDWKTKLYERIDWPKKDTQEYIDLYRTKQTTNFIDPFQKAAGLLTSNAAQAAAGDCIRRSIMLFTDGTPEDELRILTGDKLKQHMDAVGKIVKDFQDPLPEDQKVRIYITGFKVNQRYWDGVVGAWSDIANYAPPGQISDKPTRVELKNTALDVAIKMEEITAFLSDIERFTLKSDAPGTYSLRVPKHIQSVRLTLYNLDPATTLVIKDPNGVELKPDGKTVILSGKDKSIEVWQLIKPPAGSYMVTPSKSGGSVTALFAYQNLSLNFVVDPSPPQVGEPSDIKLTLVDSSGDVVLPEDDSLTLKVFVTQDAQEIPFEWTGETYQASWTPNSPGKNEFKVVAELVGDQGDTLLNCSGDVAVDVPPPVDENLTMEITSPAACVSQPIALPVKLTYEGNDSDWASSLQWTVDGTAKPGDQAVSAHVNPVDIDRGEYELSIEPIDKATQIQILSVSAKAEINGRTVETSNGNVITIDICQVPIPCDCDAIWKLWFWPLAIVLAGLLIVLLALRFRSEPKERNYQEDKTDIARRSSWHLLFWPLLILLILEILNRLFWCCVIPLWLFLLLMLIWIIFLLWIRFMPDDGSARRRLWWLVVILLLLLIWIWYIFISNQWTFLLWLLAILLVLILAIILWPVPPSPPFVQPIVPPVPPTSPDDLTVIEGIGPQVAKLLNEKGNIYTFRQLAEADINDLNTLLNQRGWKYMDPKTWPYQAELADAAKKSGDWDKFNEYAAWVKDGIAPHEYNEPEKDRKPPEEPKKPD